MSRVRIGNGDDGTTDRALGIGCAASGVLGVALGALTLGWPPAVDSKVWSYPFSFVAGVLVGVALALVHLMSLGGLLGVRSLVDGRAARLGASVAIGGFALLSACELAGGAIGRDSADSSPVDVVGAAFGVASLLVACGSIMSGVVIIRGARGRSGQGAVGWPVLLSGLTLLLLVTPANISGELTVRMAALMVWSVLFIPLGMAVARTHSPRSSEMAAADRFMMG